MRGHDSYGDEDSPSRVGIPSYLALIVLSMLATITAYTGMVLWVISSSLSLTPSQVGFVLTQVLKVILSGANLGVADLVGFPDAMISSRLAVALIATDPLTFFGVTNVCAAIGIGFFAERSGKRAGAFIAPLFLSGVTYGELTNPFLFKSLHTPLYFMGILAVQVGGAYLVASLVRALRK